MNAVLRKKVGSGSFGDVYVVNCCACEIAVKTIETAVANTAEREAMAMELTVCSMLKHDALIETKKVIVQPKRVHICMKLATGTVRELTEKAQNTGELPLPNADFIFKQVLKAIKYLHACGIVHRDIKSSNVLVDNDGNILLCDFGLSGRVNTLDRRTHFGNPIYTGPEVYQTENGSRVYEFDPLTDVYSTALLRVETQGGDEAVLRWALHRLLAFESSRKMQPKMYDLISRMLEYEDRKQRPSAAEVLAELGEKDEEYLETLPTEDQFTVKYQYFRNALLEKPTVCAVSFWIRKKFQVRSDTLERLSGKKSMTWESFRDMKLKEFSSDPDYFKLLKAQRRLTTTAGISKAQEDVRNFAKDNKPEDDTDSD